MGDAELAEYVDGLAAEHGFSGVVSVDRAGEVEHAAAYGLAHRALRVPNTVDTRFGVASGSKAMTALAVVDLVERGVLTLATTARSILGADLPLIRDDVTVEHLLGHRSGIGDYLDEEAGGEITDYALPVPMQDLATTEGFLAVLDGFPTVFPPDERFAYCNGGYIVLALLAERAAGVPFHDLVDEHVCGPAGMADSGYLRSDELPDRTALGYLGDGPRTNVLHLPVRGNGDGGLYSTAADVTAFWAALFAGRIVPAARVAEMVRLRSTDDGPWGYGLGFWVSRQDDRVLLEGYDAGVSFRSVHDPASRRTMTVLANSSEGAWPVARPLTIHLAGRPAD